MAEAEEIRLRAVELLVVAPITPIVDQIATTQSRRASRYLGDIAHNVAVEAWDGTIRRIAQSKWDVKVLIEAADTLKEIPYSEPVRARDFEDVSVGKARAYILNTIRKECVKAINHAYDEQPTLDSIDKAENVLHGFREVGDPLLEFHKADTVTIHGNHVGRPGRVDWAYVSMAIAKIITEKKLDRLTEVLLHDDFRRKDGSFMWSEHADKVWMACGLPVKALYSEKDRGRRAEMARRAARNRFAWLPGAITYCVSRLSPDEWDTPRSEFSRIAAPVEITQQLELEVQARSIAKQVIEQLQQMLEAQMEAA